MRTNRIKLFAIIFFAALVVLLTVFKETPARVAPFIADEPSVSYKAKCAACHTPTASKFYDPAKSDEEHVAAIMKGRKGEKPPFMPGYEAKGMTEEEAKALAAYMKTLKPAK
jgi:mono/diheme cytochrome c family protein